ncbi:MAG: hypothetical protein KGQ41_09145 [Alphaproteobacteria bacterium]|nr:hypothetical protein [Alphaproteobacteria bacterium]
MLTTYKTILLGLSLGIALLACPHARAQEQDATEEQTKRLLQFAANNTEFDEKVEAQAKDLFKEQITSCKSPEKAVRQLPRLYGQIQFPADPNNQFPPPTYGVWSEHVKIKGCGKIWDINMLGVARQKGMPMLLALLPGQTLSDPAIQRNAERVGATTVKKADAESCAADANANYTVFLGYRTPEGGITKTDAGQGWFEEWTYDFCQQSIPVQMVYMPNGKNGFDIKARIVPSAMPKVPLPKPTASPEVSAPAKPEAPVAPAPEAPASGTDTKGLL